MLRDARTGLVLRVPDGWSVAPRSLVEESLARQFEGRKPPRVVFLLVHESSVAQGRASTLVALAEPIRRFSSEALPATCADLLGDVRAQEPRAQLEETRRIGDTDFCGFLVPTAGLQPFRFWWDPTASICSRPSTIRSACAPTSSSTH